jgi:hypothetical protein
MSCSPLGDIESFYNELLQKPCKVPEQLKPHENLKHQYKKHE